MRLRLLLAGVTASAVVGCATADPEVVETQVDRHDYEQQFTDEWPLTVRGGTLGCHRETGEVFFRPTGEDERYLLSGPGTPRIDALTRPGGDLSRLVGEGERLCDRPR